MQAYLGITTPAAGFIAPGDLIRSPAERRLADHVAPGCEPEVALRLGRDLPAGRCTRAEAAAAVAEVFAGIELVENRYVDFRSIGAPTLIADQFFHSAAVLGAPAAARFGGLKAGQVVFLGSVTPPVWIDGPCLVTAEFDLLGKVEIRFR